MHRIREEIMITRKGGYCAMAFSSQAGSAWIYYNAIQFVMTSRLRLVSGDQIALELISEMGEYGDALVEEEIRRLSRIAVASRWPEVWLY